MFKKIVLFALLLLPMGVFAQENAKIAHVNSMEIFNAMPETAAAEKEFAAFNQSFQDELKRLEEEYNKKYTEYMQQQDSLTQSIRIRRLQEVKDLEERIQTFYQQSSQESQKKREDLNMPIIQKIQNAIKAVGDENGYTYVMEAGAFIYVSPKAIDATPLVRTKLGLK